MKEFKVKSCEPKEYRCRFVNGTFYINTRNNSWDTPDSVSDNDLVIEYSDGLYDAYKRIPSECPCTFTELLFDGTDTQPVPKKVKMSNDFSKDFLGKCPNCGLAFATFLAVECHLNYCPSCGQKLELDWKEVENS